MKYDKELIAYSNEGYLPSEIADALIREHGLDPAKFDRKAVEQRLRLIKTKGLAKLAPVNEDSDLLARDTARRCMVLIFFYSFIDTLCRATFGNGNW